MSRFVHRSHTAIRECWIQKYKPKRPFYRKTNIDEFIVDETQIKVGSSEYIWLWVAIEPKDKEILSITISKERNMFLAERAFCRHWFKLMESIQFLQTEVHGIHRKRISF